MKLLCVGSVAFDSIKTPFGKVKKTLGGSASYFSLAASYFTKTGLVSVVGRDFTKGYEQILSRRGINLSGLEKSPGKTFCWSGVYGFDLNTRKSLFTRLNVLGSFQPKIPPALQNSDYIFLSSISPTQQRQFLSQINRPKFVGWDTISFWIEHDPKGLIQNLKLIDCCFINDTEARELTKEPNLLKAAKKLRGWMKTSASLIIKQGEHGLLMFSQASPSPPGRGVRGEGSEMKIFHLPGYPLEDVIDPTGAGDSFAGGFMGYLAKTGDVSWNNLKKACVVGSSLASFCVEKLGTERLQNLKTAEINRRLREFKQLTNFD